MPVWMVDCATMTMAAWLVWLDRILIPLVAIVFRSSAYLLILLAVPSCLYPPIVPLSMTHELVGTIVASTPTVVNQQRQHLTRMIVPPPIARWHLRILSALLTSTYVRLYITWALLTCLFPTGVDFCFCASVWSHHQCRYIH